MNVVAFAFAAWPAGVVLASSPSLFGSPGVVAPFVQLVQPLPVAETRCLDVVGRTTGSSRRWSAPNWMKTLKCPARQMSELIQVPHPPWHRVDLERHHQDESLQLVVLAVRRV